MTSENKVDIAFLQPSGYGSSGFPTGIGILAQILIDNGVNVTVVDASSENLNVKQAVDQILSQNPKILGLTGMAHSSLFIKQVSKAIRNLRPEIVQITGGAWVNSVEEFVLRNVTVDFVVTGEAEEIIVEFVQAIINGDQIPDFPGLSYLKDDQFVTVKPGRTTGRGFMYVPRKVFQQLPLPAYHLFDMEFYTVNSTPEEYFWFTGILPELRKKGEHNKNIKVGTILSGRGCFGKCDFCGAAQTARRNSTPTYVADNMVHMNEKYGTNTFLFMESLTFAAPKWVKVFCQELVDRNLNFHWVAISRGDFNYDDEMLDLLTRSGCIAINIGFESGSNDLLKKMHKEVTVQQYEDIYRDFSSQNILVFGQFITNMPGETISSLNETADFVRRTKMLFSFGAAHPYADSKLFDWANEHKFCEVKDVMFTRENKGKFSRNEIKDYIDRWNFNNFQFEDFHREWKNLNRIKFENSLIHSNKYIQYYIVKLIPAFFADRILNASMMRKRIGDYAHLVEMVINQQGLFTGTHYLMRKLLSKAGILRINPADM